VSDAGLRARLKASGLRGASATAHGHGARFDPPGSCEEGASSDDGEAWKNEKPRHKVTIRSFLPGAVRGDAGRLDQSPWGKPVQVQDSAAIPWRA